ncbi:hypothetical protein DSO57_1038127 [Entomophthora muscae]|uniref:Uncharacterized protein n=1 Tax=Entomophthora muscae TaxID=34485 RepID=A0ACC2T9G1_9FUNG|nr:hypothetical protein DSO57_1038127 [Entomophthora muscae]
MLAGLDMLSGLASLSGYADWVFRLFLEESGPQHLFGWNWLYNHLVTLAKNVRSSQDPVYSILESDKIMLRCFLRLFTAVFSNSKLAHASPGEGYGITTLRPLFVLITCPLDTDLKALFLRAIGAWLIPSSVRTCFSSCGLPSTTLSFWAQGSRWRLR